MSERNSTPLPISRSRLDEGDHDLTADLDLAFDGAEDMLRAWRRGMRPDPDLTVSEWADQHRKLSSRASAEPGQYRTARTPYLREIMDALSPRHPAQRISFMKAAQVGATEAGNNWIGFVIHHAPGPMLAVLPTVEMATRTSRGRIDPLIEDSPALKERVQPARSRDAGNSMLSKEFPGGILVLTGANSATGLRSMPARYIFLDEVDAYPASADEEGDPVTLAEARTTTFSHRRKVFMVSTPNLDRIETIRAGGKIDGADPSMAMLSGSMEVRFADTTLMDQAINGTDCALEFAYSLPTGESLTFAAHSVYLPRPRVEIGGPQGVQATFDWQTAKDSVTGRMCTVTLINGVEAY